MLGRDPWEPVENYKASDSPLAANEDADRVSNRYPENGRRNVTARRPYLRKRAMTEAKPGTQRDTVAGF